ncbi:hypothetical protein DL96DRAFT_1566073 [Flagelloscypha sp. PMI_526]|nr:hypothetical protein DL96DRAFT_1566073 [Flagelloscypha sp. PMI_526]
MSGLEVFGALGTAVSVLAGIAATKSYISDVHHATKEKDAVKEELQRIYGLVNTLDEVILSISDDSAREFLTQASADFKCSVDSIHVVVTGSNSPFKWTLNKAKIKSIQGKLDHIGSLMGIALTGHNTSVMNEFSASLIRDVELRGSLDKIKKDIDAINVFVEIERLHAIQKWLTSNFLLEDELSGFQQMRKPHSGKWLLESLQFQNWLVGTHRVLVLKGPPGCGKTILSAAVAEHLESLHHCFFPVFIQHSSNMTSKAVLCRILSFALGRSATSRSTMGLSAEVPSSLMLLYQRQKLSDEDVQQITSTFLRSMCTPLYIVIDALDELSITPRNDLITLLLDLSPQVRLFIATRPLAVDHPHVSLSLQSSDMHDLRSFVHSEIENLDYAKYGEPEDIFTLKELVMNKSSNLYVANIWKETSNDRPQNHRFLLASLHIRELKGCLDMDDALEVAANLPSTDMKRYSRSIERIRSRDSRRATTAIHCLVWVWQAKRKLTLEELQTAVACSTRDLTNRSVNRALVPRHQLLDLCDGLLIASDHDEYITFVPIQASLKFFQF